MDPAVEVALAIILGELLTRDRINQSDIAGIADALNHRAQYDAPHIGEPLRSLAKRIAAIHK